MEKLGLDCSNLPVHGPIPELVGFTSDDIVGGALVIEEDLGTAAVDPQVVFVITNFTGVPYASMYSIDHLITLQLSK